MTQRDEFNLDELLGERYVRHYLRFIRDSASPFYMAPDPSRPEPEGENFWRRSTRKLYDTDDDIERHGDGPDNCSSSFALDTLPGFVWDVCGYYRLLGAHPQMTRRQLRLAYLRHGGLNSRRKTYALKQLLDERVKKLYDRHDPLTPFLLDQDTADAIKRAAALTAMRRTAKAGRPVSAGDVLTDWGMRQNTTREDAKRAYEQMGMPDPQGKYGPESSALGATLTGWEYQWSWYVLDDPRILDGFDYSYLATWQHLIRVVLDMHGRTARFAVGVKPGDGYRVWRMSGGMCIVFLGRDQEADLLHLARKAVDEVMHLSSGGKRRHGIRKRSSPV